MSWTVMAFCYIDYDDENTEIEKQLEKICEEENIEIWNTDYQEGHINFTVSGNKGIDYTFLDRLVNWLKENDIHATISTNEYSETGGGYYKMIPEEAV